jgi:hypothetical protein
MVTFQSPIAEPIPPGFHWRGTAPDLPVLRGLFQTLLADVPPSDRRSMLQRLERMRRADDVLLIRATFFSLVARTHGEAVAHDRLAQLDAQLN